MSAKPILYYVPQSPPARTVLLVAKELDLELELKVVDFANGENKKPEFLKMNPQHTVPTLDDNGNYLWDSHAIITYLVGKYGKSDDHPLYPKDLYTRARIDQRLHFESGVLFNSVISMFRPVFYEGLFEYPEKGIQNAYAALDTLETFLAVDPYLVGDQLTLADFSVIAPVTQLATQIKLEADKYPKVLAWIKRLEQLPYFNETNTKNVALFESFIEGVFAKNKAAAQ